MLMLIQIWLTIAIRHRFELYECLLYVSVCVCVCVSNFIKRCRRSRRRITVHCTSVARSRTSVHRRTLNAVSSARWCSCSRHAGGMSGQLSRTGTRTHTRTHREAKTRTSTDTNLTWCVAERSQSVESCSSREETRWWTSATRSPSICFALCDPVTLTFDRLT